MKQSIRFKAFQRQTKFRNPNCLFDVPEDFRVSATDALDIERYFETLYKKDIHFTFPRDAHYPAAFYFMKEPPLFIEYIGTPSWMTSPVLSVVGSRDCHPLTREWILREMVSFLKESQITLASGGAKGVDQLVHLASIKAGLPTIAVLPSGFAQIYPQDLIELQPEIIRLKGCFMTEFETHQKIHKSFFFFRNRLISALGKMCLVAQSTEKSGTMLTVHHALENGRPVLTIPSHPGLLQFSGNLKLMKEGASLVSDSVGLLDLWRAEGWPN